MCPFTLIFYALIAVLGLNIGNLGGLLGGLFGGTAQ